MLRNLKVKKLICLCLAVFIVFGLSGCGNAADYRDLTVDINPKEVQGKEADEEFLKAYGDFAVESFKNFTENDENAMISPVSVMLALALTANGAEGKTLEEMKKVLAEGIDTESLNEYLYSVSEYLTEGESSMRIANSVWFRDEENLIQVKEDFLQTAADYYGAQIFKEPFDQQTVDDINGWVKENTGGMIDKILDEIDIDTIMYLINAITFEAEWERIYYDDEIFDGIFSNSDGTESEREFMRSEENKYINYNGADGFIKDYKGGKFSFAALLPPEGESLESFIQSMEGEGLTETFNNYQSEQVFVTMPKFSCEYEAELKEPLIGMGMEQAFDSGKAQFGKMCQSTAGNVYISNVVHKTFINVDERGTTAGAATMVEIKNEGALETGKEVCLDRPFVYFIIDRERGMPLFIGQITGF